VRGRAREVYRQIVGDEEPEPPVSRFPRAGQNVVVATMLLRNMPEPSNSQARRIRDVVQTLLQVAAAQQAESSASRHRGLPQRNMSSRPETRGKYRFIKGHPLEEGKPRPSKSTPSMINGNTTLDMTSTSIAAVGMGTQRSAATAPTAADVTTTTRTEWLQSHRALESSAEQSAARRCPVRFDLRLASPNTMAKPSPSSEAVLPTDLEYGSPRLKSYNEQTNKETQKTRWTNSRKLETWPSSTPQDTSRSFDVTTTSMYAKGI
jgi:hypothetical protein